MSGSLTNLNTLGVPATADQIEVADSEHAMRGIMEQARQDGRRLLVIGGGSNLVLQRHCEGVVCLMRMRGIAVRSIAADAFAVSAGAGEGWHAMVRYCLGRGLYGLENLALIPGSVGAAPIQNIGAYGVELEDRFLSLKAMDAASGEIREFDRAACGFSYRDSLFKTGERDRYVVLEVTLRVSTTPAPVLDYPDVKAELVRMGHAHPTPVQIAEAVIRIRRRKLPDPRVVGNVGSFFKNPVVTVDRVDRLRGELSDLVVHAVDAGRFKLSAAQLIDRAGWKGVRRPRVGVWPRQPLVLVNLGGGNGADFLTLGGEIRADVLKRFGVELEFEPRVCGEP